MDEHPTKITDQDAKRVIEHLHLAYWPTVTQAILAAKLEVISDPTGDCYIFRNPRIGYVSFRDKYKNYEFICVVRTDGTVSYDKRIATPKPPSEPDTPSRIEQALAELRHDLEDISRRVKVLTHDHVGRIKPEQQPQ